MCRYGTKSEATLSRPKQALKPRPPLYGGSLSFYFFQVAAQKHWFSGFWGDVRTPSKKVLTGLDILMGILGVSLH